MDCCFVRVMLLSVTPSNPLLDSIVNQFFELSLLRDLRKGKEWVISIWSSAEPYSNLLCGLQWTLYGKATFHANSNIKKSVIQSIKRQFVV